MRGPATVCRRSAAASVASCLSATPPRRQLLPSAKGSRRQRATKTSRGDCVAVSLAATPTPHQENSTSTSSSSSSSSSSSLIPETLANMENDEDFQRATKALRERGQAALTRDENAARRRSLSRLGLPSFAEAIRNASSTTPSIPPVLTRSKADTIQLNIGLRCNQACSHCHVESSPLRTEAMTPETARRCLELARRAKLASSSSPPSLRTLDITGGAPELHGEVFRELVVGGRALGLEVVDRCNLTVLTEPEMGMELARFLADNRVRVVASLPCYTPGTVDAQRGRGVFERSIEGLKMLNAVGYGRKKKNEEKLKVKKNGEAKNDADSDGDDDDLVLDLVYNPSGAFLAPQASSLEPAYRRELLEAHGIEFTSLLALNNMPVKRFADFLIQRGELDSYLSLLVDSFNAAAVPGLMCRGTVSVGWDGALYDCDFNQQLAMAMMSGSGGGGDDDDDFEKVDGGNNKQRKRLTVFDVESLDELEGRRIAVGSHCYGCTSGNGSGCQGATSGAAS